MICVVYAVNTKETIDSITDYWLPLIRNTLGSDHLTPVIIVGNKSDQADANSLETVVPIMNDYAEIETCVEVSSNVDITNMVYFVGYLRKGSSNCACNYSLK